MGLLEDLKSQDLDALSLGVTLSMFIRVTLEPNDRATGNG
jgi:hypothetical protein